MSTRAEEQKAQQQRVNGARKRAKKPAAPPAADSHAAPAGRASSREPVSVRSPISRRRAIAAPS